LGQLSDERVDVLVTAANRGKFLVLEGVDGAGTTTQSRLLAANLSKAGQRVHWTCEPSQGPIGRMIRELLGSTSEVALLEHWSTMALLFAADRSDHFFREVRPKLEDGVWVVSDRYDYSSVAYQSLTALTVMSNADVVSWIRTLNARVERPDLTLVLDVTFEVANARVRQRTQQDAFEKDALQRKLVSFYSEIETWFSQDKIVHLDGEAPITDVQDQLSMLVREQL